MNFKDINVTLRAAAALCALNKHHVVADKLGEIADLFREFLDGTNKLAEREKALTEALKELESAFCDIAEHEFGPTYKDHYAIIQARAALALHKEDA